MRARTFLSSVPLFILLCVTILAQPISPRPKDTGWLLEVTYLKGSAPAYESVRWRDSQTPGNWFARFGHVAGWQLPAGAQPIKAVRIAPHLEDGTVRITVSVMRGFKFMDTEETVATYDLMENQKVTVEPLKTFGVEPFEIRAVKASPVPATLPTAVNHTASVEVVALEPVVSTLPECRITLHNLSTKTIEALRIEFVEDYRTVGSGMPQGLEGKPLMRGGETVQVRLPIAVRAIGNEGTYAPAVPSQQQIVIKSVIFADGTAEGTIDSDMASGPGFQSVKFGRRIELQRALPLFAAALESTIAISADGAGRFRSQLDQLNVGITDAELVDLEQRFPTSGPRLLKPPVEFGIHLMRKEMLDRLRRFETGLDGKDFRAWLVNAQDRYSQWLARLQAAETSQP